MNKLSYIVLILLALFITSDIFAQKKKKKKKQLNGKDVENLSILELDVVEGDTIPAYTLAKVPVVSKKMTAKEKSAYRKLKRNLIKVYPYAERAIVLLDEMERATVDMKRKRHKKKYVKQLEKELKGHFKKELKKLTTSQGRVLVKLLERRTGEPFYKLLKKVKNPVSAFVWHKVSKRYGYDLKKQYDPEGNTHDSNLEYLVSYLEDNGVKGLGYRNFPKSKALEATSDITMPSKYKKKLKENN